MKAFKKIAEHNSDNGCNECTKWTKYICHTDMDKTTV